MAKSTKLRYKKPPQAPRRFKSAYMFFSTEKHSEIRERLKAEDPSTETTTVAKAVAAEWKSLSPEEREVFEERSRQDKIRFEMERSMYTGPWRVPARRRAQKDPSAPKRPMSAFLAFSQTRRMLVRKEFPDIDNIKVSKVLAQRWKEAPEEIKLPYIDEEFKLRQKYKGRISEWRAKNQGEMDAIRNEREKVALERAMAVGAGSRSAQHASGDSPESGKPAALPLVMGASRANAFNNLSFPTQSQAVVASLYGNAPAYAGDSWAYQNQSHTGGYAEAFLAQQAAQLQPTVATLASRTFGYTPEEAMYAGASHNNSSAAAPRAYGYAGHGNSAAATSLQDYGAFSASYPLAAAAAAYGASAPTAAYGAASPYTQAAGAAAAPTYQNNSYAGVSNRAGFSGDVSGNWSSNAHGGTGYPPPSYY